MNSSQTSLFGPKFILLLLSSFSSIQCGPARALEDSLNGNHSPSDPAIASQLGLQIFSSEFEKLKINDFKKPQIEKNLEVRFQENHIFYPVPLQISNPNDPPARRKHELFFVWPETFLGSSIVHAFVTHQILDGNNQWIGLLRPTPAWHDVEKHHWFIPISELFKGQRIPLSLALHVVHTQVLILKLALSNGSQVSVEIRFRISML